MENCMNISRRQVLALSISASVAAIAGMPAFASADEAKALIDAFTGGNAVQEARITLTLPDVAENGNTVPVTVSVESAMDGDDLVDSILIVADGNPQPDVATFHFSPLSASAFATTRIRLAQSQTLTAVARMKDGTFYTHSAQVSVTVGGCTG
jgi:sulfur-oxidizing protein SoxY